eukprot:g1121.t1
MLFTTFIVLTAGTEPAHRPAPAAGQETAPQGTPNVVCGSTKGPFMIEMHPEWAPLGAKQFLDAVKDGVYDGTVIYRVDPVVRAKWQKKKGIPDDPQIFRKPNWHRGMISFAGAGPNTRGADVFIAFNTWDANGTPGAPWETPFGIINEAGLKAVGKFGGSGDLAMVTKGRGLTAPDLGKGYESLKKTHPDIDYLGKCELVYSKANAATNPFGRLHKKKGAAFGRQQGAKQQLTDARNNADFSLRGSA